MRPLHSVFPVALIALLALGCEHQAARTPTNDATPPAPARPVLWREVGGSEQVVLPMEAGDDALREAIARARETAGDARERWLVTPLEERGAWAVKWRAPTTDGGAEYVWVEPMNWSRFRIEGRLASPPRRELACGRTRDEIVGFPIEELVDWMRDGVVREGGFTVEVLEERYGGS